MNALRAPFQQLVDRKLWPIALLLVAALVAVPSLLKSGDDSEAAAPTTAAAVPSGQGETETIVSEADAAKTDRLRATLGDRKDPFRPAQLNRVPKVKEDAAAATAGATTSVDAGAGSAGGGSAAPDDTSGPETVATPTPTPAPTFELYSLKVRFGSTDGKLTTRNVKRLTGLPGGTQPAALYLGLLSDHKSAVFIIDAGVEALGDGRCDPSPEDCQTLTLKRGETEFLTRGDKEWELDLVDINVKRTTDEAAAKTSRRTIATGGRTKLRGLLGRIGAYTYDTDAGTVERLGKTAAVARAKAARNRTTSRASALTGIDG